MKTPGSTRRAEFLAGARDTLPLIIGATPFGLIFGALAVTSGISPLGTLSMSLFVFAGSSQFIAAGLVAQGVGVLVIVFTTFIVNLRHALYSATLAPHMKRLPQRWLLPLGFWLTDETFVTVVSRYNQPDPSPNKHWYHLGSSVSMYVNWQFWTLVGIIAGQSIPDLRTWGLDFALVVTFIGMLIPQIKGRPVLASVIVGGLSAVLLNDLPNRMGLISAIVLGVIAGVIVDSLMPEDRVPSSAALEGQPHV